MATDIVVPQMGESVTEGTVGRWFKQVGDAVAADEPVCEIETDKATLNIPSPVAGTLGEIVAPEGTSIAPGGVLGRIAAAGAQPAAKPAAKATPAAPKAAPAAAAKPAPAASPAAQPQDPRIAAALTAGFASLQDEVGYPKSLIPYDGTPVGEWQGGRAAAAPATARAASGPSQPLSPAVRKLVEENGLDPAAIPPTGPGGRLTKGDVLAFLDRTTAAPAPAAAPAQLAPAARPAAPAPAPAPAPAGTRAPDPRGEERVRMTRLRQTIAHRLKAAQNTAAMLTTFNEVDMSEVLFLRDRFREEFERRHGVRLGLMSFFVKAAVKALKEIPAINAEIQGDEIVYRNYYDVGVAVGGPGGLVVPVLRDADRRDFADIERSIADFGRRANEGKLTLADLTGGTFTVTNGGVFGSMLSTPILNPPQSGILGMHNIVRRPVAMRGTNGGEEIAIRPIMYLALSYDHRIVDGREAVTFLVRIKQAIEAPDRLLIGL